MDIGRRIREVREEVGMAGAVLARRAGVSKNHLYMIEHGDRTPSVALLESIARELKVEPASSKVSGTLPCRRPSLVPCAPVILRGEKPVWARCLGRASSPRRSGG